MAKGLERTCPNYGSTCLIYAAAVRQELKDSAATFDPCDLAELAEMVESSNLTSVCKGELLEELARLSLPMGKEKDRRGMQDYEFLNNYLQKAEWSRFWKTKSSKVRLLLLFTRAYRLGARCPSEDSKLMWSLMAAHGLGEDVQVVRGTCRKEWKRFVRKQLPPTTWLDRLPEVPDHLPKELYESLYAAEAPAVSELSHESLHEAGLGVPVRNRASAATSSAIVPWRPSEGSLGNGLAEMTEMAKGFMDHMMKQQMEFMRCMSSNMQQDAGRQQRRRDPLDDDGDHASAFPRKRPRGEIKLTMLKEGKPKPSPVMDAAEEEEAAEDADNGPVEADEGWKEKSEEEEAADASSELMHALHERTKAMRAKKTEAGVGESAGSKGGGKSGVGESAGSKGGGKSGVGKSGGSKGGGKGGGGKSDGKVVAVTPSCKKPPALAKAATKAKAKAAKSTSHKSAKPSMNHEASRNQYLVRGPEGSKSFKYNASTTQAQAKKAATAYLQSLLKG